MNRIIMNVIISSIMGISICLVIKAITSASEFQSNTLFVVELEKNIFPGQRITVESLLTEMPEVIKKSIEIIPAAMAMVTMKKEMPELDYLADNPFHDVIIFKSKKITIENVSDFNKKIMDISGVAGIYNDHELMETLSDASSKARIGLLIFALVLLIGSMIALGLRIKRDLLQFHDNIRIMSLAGSRDRTIISKRRLWSAKWGAASAGISAIITMLNIIFINNTLLDGLEITFLQSIISILVMIVLVIVAHVLFTHYSIKTYLTHLNTSIKS